MKDCSPQRRRGHREEQKWEWEEVLKEDAEVCGSCFGAGQFFETGEPAFEIDLRPGAVNFVEGRLSTCAICKGSGFLEETRQ
jgi:hypothetical protein